MWSACCCVVVEKMRRTGELPLVPVVTVGAEPDRRQRRQGDAHSWFRWPLRNGRAAATHVTQLGRPRRHPLTELRREAVERRLRHAESR